MDLVLDEIARRRSFSVWRQFATEPDTAHHDHHWFGDGVAHHFAADETFADEEPANSSPAS